MTFINILEIDPTLFCNKFLPVFRIFGYLFLMIKIATPILLIAVSMIQLTKAIASKSEDDVSKAWKRVAKNFIAAISVFLVFSLVGLLMNIIGGSKYMVCTSCLNHPASCSDPVVGNTGR